MTFAFLRPGRRAERRHAARGDRPGPALPRHPRRRVQAQGRCRPGRRRDQPVGGQWPDPGPGRRVGLREDHHRPPAGPAGRADRRPVVIDGRDVTHLRQGEMRPLRREIQMIFQDPYSSLNPAHTVGAIVGAPFRAAECRPCQAGSGAACRNCSNSSALIPSASSSIRTSSLAASAARRHRPGTRLAAPADRRRRASGALDVSIQAQIST